MKIKIKLNSTKLHFVGLHYMITLSFFLVHDSCHLQFLQIGN